MTRASVSYVAGVPSLGSRCTNDVSSSAFCQSVSETAPVTANACTDLETFAGTSGVCAKAAPPETSADTTAARRRLIQIDRPRTKGYTLRRAGKVHGWADARNQDTRNQVASHVRCVSVAAGSTSIS